MSHSLTLNQDHRPSPYHHTSLYTSDSTWSCHTHLCISQTLLGPVTHIPLCYRPPPGPVTHMSLQHSLHLVRSHTSLYTTRVTLSGHTSLLPQVFIMSCLIPLSFLTIILPPHFLSTLEHMDVAFTNITIVSCVIFPLFINKLILIFPSSELLFDPEL